MRPVNEIKLSIEEMEKTADTPFKRGWISALEWAMMGGGSAMCEADSNAVLGEVRTDIKYLLFYLDTLVNLEHDDQPLVLKPTEVKHIKQFIKKVSPHFV